MTSPNKTFSDDSTSMRNSRFAGLISLLKECTTVIFSVSLGKLDCNRESKICLQAKANAENTKTGLSVPAQTDPSLIGPATRQKIRRPSNSSDDKRPNICFIKAARYVDGSCTSRLATPLCTAGMSMTGKSCSGDGNGWKSSSKSSLSSAFISASASPASVAATPSSSAAATSLSLSSLFCASWKRARFPLRLLPATAQAEAGLGALAPWLPLLAEEALDCLPRVLLLALAAAPLPLLFVRGEARGRITMSGSVR